MKKPIAVMSSCPHCQGRIYGKVKACPHCSRPISWEEPQAEPVEEPQGLEAAPTAWDEPAAWDEPVAWGDHETVSLDVPATEPNIPVEPSPTSTEPAPAPVPVEPEPVPVEPAPAEPSPSPPNKAVSALAELAKQARREGAAAANAQEGAPSKEQLAERLTFLEARARQLGLTDAAMLGTKLEHPKVRAVYDAGRRAALVDAVTALRALSSREAVAVVDLLKLEAHLLQLALGEAVDEG